jgi:hypothetical protein
VPQSPVHISVGCISLRPRNKEIGAGKFDNVPTATNFLLMQTLCGCSGCPGRMKELFLRFFQGLLCFSISGCKQFWLLTLNSCKWNYHYFKIIKLRLYIMIKPFITFITVKGQKWRSLVDALNICEAVFAFRYPLRRWWWWWWRYRWWWRQRRRWGREKNEDEDIWWLIRMLLLVLMVQYP